MNNQLKNKEAWAKAKKQHRLSNEIVRMARKLGLNPKKFGGYNNHKQEHWKEPLPTFIRNLYEKRFKKVIINDKVNNTDR